MVFARTDDQGRLNVDKLRHRVGRSGELPPVSNRTEEQIENMAQTNANLIWKIADLLRGPYQPNQYGDVILPFTILRRLDCILEPTKDEVLAEYNKVQGQKIDQGVVLKSTFKLSQVVVVVLATASAKARSTVVAEAVCMALAAVGQAGVLST